MIHHLFIFRGIRVWHLGFCTVFLDPGHGLRVWGLGSAVGGLGLEVGGIGLGGWGVGSLCSEFRVQGSVISRVQSGGFRVQDSGVLGFKI